MGSDLWGVGAAKGGAEEGRVVGKLEVGRFVGVGWLLALRAVLRWGVRSVGYTVELQKRKQGDIGRCGGGRQGLHV